MSSRSSRSQKRPRTRKMSPTENRRNDNDDEHMANKMPRRSSRLQKRPRNATTSRIITTPSPTTRTNNITTTEGSSDNLEIVLDRSFLDKISQSIDTTFKIISKRTQIIPSDDEDVVCIDESFRSNEAFIISDESDIEESPTQISRNNRTLQLDISQPSTSYANSHQRSINTDVMGELQQQQQQQQQQTELQQEQQVNESHNLKKLEDLRKETEDLLRTAAITIQEFTTDNNSKETILKDDDNKGSGDVTESPTFTKACPICLEPLFAQPTVSTICGHIYCEECIKAVIQSSKRCPTCRKALTLKKIHPIYL